MPDTPPLTITTLCLQVELNSFFFASSPLRNYIHTEVRGKVPKKLSKKLRASLNCHSSIFFGKSLSIYLRKNIYIPVHRLLYGLQEVNLKLRCPLEGFLEILLDTLQNLARRGNMDSTVVCLRFL